LSRQGDMKRTIGMYKGMAESVPQLRRNRVWCLACGRTEVIDSAECLRSGWPKCHGTMSIDSPEERAALRGS
jgi:hypothetical protein